MKYDIVTVCCTTGLQRTKVYADPAANRISEAAAAGSTDFDFCVK